MNQAVAALRAALTVDTTNPVELLRWELRVPEARPSGGPAVFHTSGIRALDERLRASIARAHRAPAPAAAGRAARPRRMLTVARATTAEDALATEEHPRPPVDSKNNEDEPNELGSLQTGRLVIRTSGHPNVVHSYDGVRFRGAPILPDGWMPIISVNADLHRLHVVIQNEEGTKVRSKPDAIANGLEENVVSTALWRGAQLADNEDLGIPIDVWNVYADMIR